MELAVMNYHYIRYPFSRFLEKAEHSPFHLIELYAAAPHLNIYDYTLKSLLDMDKEIRKRGLGITCITPENCTYPINFSSQERGLRDSSLRYYQRVVDTAEFLDASRVQLCLGYGYFDRGREEAWKYGKDSLIQIANYARKKDVTLILEELKKTTSNVINSSEQLAMMLDQVNMENVVGMMDLDQMSDWGETPDDYFKHLGKRLQHIHFNDRGHTVPGDGGLPIKKYYEQIKANGYEGSCSFEICDRRYYCDPDQAIDSIADWFRENTQECI